MARKKTRSATSKPHKQAGQQIGIGANVTDQSVGQPIDVDTSVTDQSADQPIDDRRKIVEALVADLLANPRPVFELHWVFGLPVFEPLTIAADGVYQSTAQLLCDTRLEDEELVLYRTAQGFRYLPNVELLRATGDLPADIQFPVYILDVGSRLQRQAAAKWVMTAGEPQTEIPDLGDDNGREENWYVINRLEGAAAILKLIGPLVKLAAPDIYEGLLAQAERGSSTEGAYFAADPSSV